MGDAVVLFGSATTPSSPLSLLDLDATEGLRITGLRKVYDAEQGAARAALDYFSAQDGTPAAARAAAVRLVSQNG